MPLATPLALSRTRPAAPPAGPGETLSGDVAESLAGTALCPLGLPFSADSACPLAGFAAANPPLAVLADQLRAPLVPMIGFAELLAEEPLPPHIARRYGQEILASSRQLLAVLDRTLALLSRQATTGHPPDPVVDVQAQHVLAALVVLLRQNLTEIDETLPKARKLPSKGCGAIRAGVAVS